MILTELQQDGFAELINIAFARAAASLSELIGKRVLLDVPQVSIHSISSLSSEFTYFKDEEIATISQAFKGSMSGNAVLMLDYDSALMLTNLILGNQEAPITQLDTSAQEVLTEVGNILLNACLGIFGNLLEIPVIFSVPILSLNKLDKVVNSMISRDNELRYTLLIRTAMRIVDDSVVGHIALVSSVSSLYCLMRAIETWAEISAHNLTEEKSFASH